MVQGDHSVHERDSPEAPSLNLEGPPIAIKFNSEVSSLFSFEVQRLQKCSIICRMVGSRPNRGLLRDLVQAKLQVQVTHVQILGLGFYHIEFTAENAVEKAIEDSPIDLGGSLAFCMNWRQGFIPKEAANSFGNMVVVMAFFPGLRKEYLPFLKEIGGQIGNVMKKRGSQQHDDDVFKGGIPAVRIMLDSLQK